MRALIAWLSAFLSSGAALAAQDDPVFVLAGTGYSTPGEAAVLCFDRRLVLQATLPTHYSLVSGYGTPFGACMDGQRRLWVPFPGTPEQIARVDASGALIDTVVTPQLISSPVVAGNGDIYGLVGSWSGALGLDADGGLLWSTSFGGWFYFTDIVKPCLTAQGRLWFGGIQTCGFAGESAVLHEVDTFDGDFGATIMFPGFAPCQSGVMGQLAPDPDGSMWAWVPGSAATGYKPALVKTDGAVVLQTLTHDSSKYGNYQFPYLFVDGLGRVLCNAYSGCYCVDYCICWGSEVRRYDPSSPAAPASFPMGGFVRGFALGPTGEELFAVTAQDDWSMSRGLRVVRLNLVTGARSTVPAPDGAPYLAVPHGDPGGFVLANTVAREQDFDADGAANGIETAAGSNPFDPESRPDGPKVYVAFAPGSNAIVMTLFDPDGLRHPTKGIDFATMSVTVGGSSNLFWPLLSLVTEASLSADGKTAHAVFGGLPLASDSKLRVEMSVRDRTGAVSWDWQATPPGDL